jgi:MFS family permease
MTPKADKKALLVIFLTVFIDLLGFGMVIPLLPVYARLFTVDQSGWTIGLLMGSFSAMQFLFAPIWGRLSDRIGRRPVLMIGLCGSVLFYVLFGVATAARSLAWLFVSRIGAGVCGATIPTTQAYIADVTNVENRARGMALIGAAFGLGFTFGPLIGALALAGGGSAATAHPVPAAAAASGVASNTALPQPAPTEASPWPGYLAAGLSAIALVLAVRYLPESLRRDSAPARHKLIDVSALAASLAIPSMAILLFSSFGTVLSFSNLESTLSLLLKDPRGGFEYDFKSVLLVFAYIGLILSLAQGLLVRRMAGRVPEPTLAAIGGVTTIIGYLLVPVASRQASLPLLLAALLIEVTGFAFLPTALNALISRRADPARQGAVLGVNQSIASLARIVGPVLGIRLFYIGSALPFVAAAALMSVSLLLVLVAATRGRDYPASPTLRA